VENKFCILLHYFILISSKSLYIRSTIYKQKHQEIFRGLTAERACLIICSTKADVIHDLGNKDQYFESGAWSIQYQNKLTKLV